MPRLPRPLPPYDVNADRYPDDDHYIEQWKITMLNRIDKEYGCDFILNWNVREGPTEYCGMPEHDPFTNKCYHHGVSGHLPGGSI